MSALSADDLRAFVEDATGRAVVDLRRLPGGGRRQGWDVLQAGDGPDSRCAQAVLLSHEPGVPQFTAIGDGAVQAALQDQLVNVLANLTELRRELDRRVGAGEIGVREALPVMAREVQRQVARAADVMGVLARRSSDPIDKEE